VIRAFRALRHLLRKSTKPARLWLNAWQHKRSEARIASMYARGESARRRMQCEYKRQVELAMRRTEIVRW
jgi:hypothetical protein